MTVKLSPAARKARNTKRMAAGTFYTTAAATVGANMYASEHSFIGLTTGFWTPVALFLSLELLERFPAKGWAGVLRKIAVGVIAVIAAWVSYWHLVHIFTSGGADVVAAHAMPVTVDVLMALARGAMIHRPAAPARKRTAVAKAPAKLRSVKSA